jgi:hypothetical protein
LVTLPASAQVTIWSDNFNNGCASNCLATTWNGWTVQNNIGGTSGSASNNWFVSCAEEGVVPPGCGSTCIGDASLHIGANAGAGGDMGASFNETGATNATYKLAVSPVINTSGISTAITLSFDFIAFGSAACSDDRGQLWLSTDNGATWPAGYRYCLTSVCCGGAACNGYAQGQWTNYVLALPAAFNNNPNVRVAYHWRNNGNGSGTDPSIAVDDIRVTTVLGLSLNLIEFSAQAENSNILLKWKSADEVDFSHYEIERSEDGHNFMKIGTVKGKGGPNQQVTYNFEDVRSKTNMVYYRLKMLDLNGEFSYSNTLAINPKDQLVDPYSLIHSGIADEELTVILQAKKQNTVKYTLYSSIGNIVYSSPSSSIKPGNNLASIPLKGLSSGIYILKAHLDGEANALTLKVRVQ